MLQNYTSSIKEFAYRTSNADFTTDFMFTPGMADSGKQSLAYNYMVGVSPSSYIDQQIEDVIYYQDEESGLGISEQLYTPRGSQGYGLLQSWVEIFTIDMTNYKSLLLEITWSYYEGNWAQYTRPLFSVTDYPSFVVIWDPLSITSIPYYSLVTNTTMDEIPYYNLFIQMNDPDDHTTIDSICTNLAEAAPGVSIQKTFDKSTSTSKIQKILDKTFYGLISVTMFLCFFSLSASMSANLYE